MLHFSDSLSLSLRVRLRLRLRIKMYKVQNDSLRFLRKLVFNATHGYTRQICTHSAKDHIHSSA